MDEHTDDQAPTDQETTFSLEQHTQPMHRDLFDLLDIAFSRLKYDPDAIDWPDLGQQFSRYFQTTRVHTLLSEVAADSSGLFIIDEDLAGGPPSLFWRRVRDQACLIYLQYKFQETDPLLSAILQPTKSTRLEELLTEYAHHLEEPDSDDTILALLDSVRRHQQSTVPAEGAPAGIEPQESPAQPDQLLMDSQLQSLTPRYLASEVLPYLEAITHLQHIIDEMQEREHRLVRIRSISQHSAITISMEGAAEALDAATALVVPWRRKHAQKMATLEEQRTVVDIEAKKAEVLEKRARASRDRAEAAGLAPQAVLQREEVRRMQLENERLEHDLQRARIELALDVIERTAPNLSEQERLEYVVRLLPPLNVLTSSELEIAVSDPEAEEE